MTVEKATSHIKVTRPPSLFQLPPIGKCIHINNSNSQYESEIISLNIHERNYVILPTPSLDPTLKVGVYVLYQSVWVLILAEPHLVWTPLSLIRSKQ